MPYGLDPGRDSVAPKGYGGAARIEEERGLPPGQKVPRDGMYRYFAIKNFFFFFFTIVICHLLCFYFKSLFLFGKQAVQSTFRMEEIYHSAVQQLEEERRRRVAAVQTMSVAEKSNTELKERVKAEEQLRKSAEAALKGAETQAESQRKMVIEVKGQLVTAKEQIANLRQQLEEANQLKALAEKARAQAEEDKLKAEKERDEDRKSVV